MKTKKTDPDRKASAQADAHAPKQTPPPTAQSGSTNERHTAQTDAHASKQTPPPTAQSGSTNERHTAQADAHAPKPTPPKSSTAEPAASPSKHRQLRTIEDYNALYIAKTGDTPTMPHGFTCSYLPERGWCQWRLDSEGKLLLIWGVSGDGHFWRDWARATGLALGCYAIVTICTRPIRAYIRLWHWHIDRTETKGGKHRFHCHTADGRRVLITHKHTDPDGQDAYWVTEHLTERNDTHG